MGLQVVLPEVTGVVHAALQLEAHLQVLEIVVKVHRLGVLAVVELFAEDVTPVVQRGNGARQFRVLPLFGGALVQEADIVEAHVQIDPEALGEGTQVLAQGGIGQYFGLGPLALAVLLHYGHRVHGAVQGAAAIDAVGLLHREGGGGQHVQGLFNVVGVIPLVELAQAGHHANLHGRGTRDVHVHVGAEPQAVVVMVGIVAVVGRAFLVQEVFLQVILQQHLSLIGEVVPVDPRLDELIEHYPVHVGVGIRILSAVEGQELGVGVLGRKAVQAAGFVHHEAVGVGIGKFRCTEHGGHAVAVLGAHLEAGVLAAAGGNHDHAVTAFYAIQRCGGRVLEYGHGFNLQSGDILHVTG